METDSVKIRKLRGENEIEMQDTIAVEKRFCICVEGGREFHVSCTPSHLEELVLGQLFAGGVLRTAEELVSWEIHEENGRIYAKICLMDSEACAERTSDTNITIKKNMAEAICETKSKNTEAGNSPAKKIEESLSEKDRIQSFLTIKKSTIFQTVTELFENPSTFFTETGCVHSCSLMLDGKIMCTMEDIARHNALDKAIGYGLKHKLPLERAVIFVSGRIAGDYLLKAVRAGIRMVVSRAAVTGEAVEIAKKEQVTLLGFVRHNSGNVYHEGTVLLR